MPEQLVGRRYLDLLDGYLTRLRAAYTHPNRVLHYDDVLVAYLLAFFNPTLRSLRCIEDATRLPGVNRFLDVGAVCRSTLSDANALFDPDLLLPLIAELRGGLPEVSLRQRDPQLKPLLDHLTLVDGSFFRLAADVEWAVRSANAQGPATGVVRLNCQFCLRTGVPVGVSVSGADGPGFGEGAAAIPFVEPGRIYLFDRGVVSFDYLQRILATDGAHVLCNLASGVNFTPHHARPLTDADHAAGVVSDRVGHLSGSTHRLNAPPQTLREVVVTYLQRNGQPATLRLLSDLLDLPAHLLAALYRWRWQIELFFRWLKVHANFTHLTSHSRNGVTLSFYVATIAAMLMCRRTGRPLSKYGYNLMAMIAAGQGDVADMLPILERREHERERERQRQARKRDASQKQA